MKRGWLTIQEAIERSGLGVRNETWQRECRKRRNDSTMCRKISSRGRGKWELSEKMFDIVVREKSGRKRSGYSVSVYLKDELVDAIEQRAAENDCTINRTVTNILKEKLLCSAS